MSTLLDMIAMVLALGLGLVVLNQPREPMARWPGSSRFALFVAVSATASVLFRALFGMLSPFVDGFVSGATLLEFVVGLVLIVIVLRVFLMLRPDTSTLLGSVASLVGRRPRAVAVMDDATDHAPANATCATCGRVAVGNPSFCEGCGAALARRPDSALPVE
jgi:hypothetical protein